jgi:hypothetical protein
VEDSTWEISDLIRKSADRLAKRTGRKWALTGKVSKVRTYRVTEWGWLIIFLIAAPLSVVVEVSAILHGAAAWKIIVTGLFALFAIAMLLSSIGYTEVRYNKETQEVRITERSFGLGYSVTWIMARSQIAKVAIVFESVTSGGRHKGSVEILLRGRKKSVPVKSAFFYWSVKKHAKRLAEMLGVEVNPKLHRSYTADWDVDADKTSWFWGLLVCKKKAKRARKRTMPACAKEQVPEDAGISIQWPLDSKDELVRNLSRLLTEGDSENYLIVSVGDVYLQFAASPGDNEIYCEAVSDKNFPPELQLTEQKVAQLNKLGFQETGHVPNYSRSFQISNEQNLTELARLTRLVLSDVYGSPPEAELRFDFNLG